MIKAEHITKSFGSVQVLKGVSLEVAPAEVVCITGASGAGKTTFLQVLGTLTRPDSGQVWIGDTPVCELKKDNLADFRNKHIGFVFQSYNLIPVLTALENVSFIMLLQKQPKAKMEERAREMLKQVGLADKMNVRPGRLSGGQQQRVAVARALASKPDFVLADEPTANLDTESAFNLLDIMARLNKEEGITLIFSTHDQRVIDRARRVITLVDGAVAEDKQKEASVEVS